MPYQASRRAKSSISPFVLVAIAVVIAIPVVVIAIAVNMSGEIESRADGDEYPAWSPDGLRIALASDDTGDWDIFTQRPDGGVRTNLTNTPEIDETRPVWSPDGTIIAFLGAASNGTDIYTMRPDGTDRKNLTNQPGSYLDLTWSPDGSKIAFASSRDIPRDDWTPVPGSSMQGPPVDIRPAELYVMNADGTGVQRLTNNDKADLNPSWSPDGTQLAFQSNRDGDYEIFVMNADGSEQKQLTSNNRVDSDPAWSPDGAWIAFSSNRAQTEFEEHTGASGQVFSIFLMRPDGSEQQNRSASIIRNDGAPRWSPDGRFILFDSRTQGRLAGVEGFNEITVITGAGLNSLRTPLTPSDQSTDPDLFTSGAWAPDSRRIAYVSRESKLGHIRVMEIALPGQAQAVR
ncbi:MAG: hypothetical protein FJ319_10855 [SAR202 cluster bacterium]|nr:hypothetical protein [SAR202 cluster bacterium]